MEPTSDIEQAVPDNTYITISLSEYKELLEYKGRYNELAQISYNKMTSPLIRPEYGHNPFGGLTRSNEGFTKAVPGADMSGLNSGTNGTPGV